MLIKIDCSKRKKKLAKQMTINMSSFLIKDLIILILHGIKSCFF